MIFHFQLLCCVPSHECPVEICGPDCKLRQHPLMKLFDSIYAAIYSSSVGLYLQRRILATISCTRKQLYLGILFHW